MEGLAQIAIVIFLLYLGARKLHEVREERTKMRCERDFPAWGAFPRVSQDLISDWGGFRRKKGEVLNPVTAEVLRVPKLAIDDEEQQELLKQVLHEKEELESLLQYGNYKPTSRVTHHATLSECLKICDEALRILKL